MKIAIDASRNRSGGTIAHLQGIFDSLPEKYKNTIEVHIWSHQHCLDKLNNYPWLHKHSSRYLEKSIFHQFFWQKFILTRKIKEKNCKILFKATASSVCTFKPCITLSQDMLPFEPGEIERFGFSLARLRLMLLQKLYISTLRSSDAVIFLTEYAAKMIQKKTGKINCYQIIPHGVPSFFFNKNKHNIPNKIDKTKKIRVIYVSEISPYKHQISVSKAISSLNKLGYKIELKLFGGGKGRYLNKFLLEKKIMESKSKFIQMNPFISQELLPRAISDSDIFLFASSCENLPITLLEGMATGKPIASSDRGPMPEVLSDGGFYFDPEKPSSIQQSLINIIEDPELADKRSKISLKRSKQYNWQNSSLKTFELLENILEKYSY